MKKGIKIASLLLALVMALSMSVIISAAGTDTHEYELYQIFTGDYAGGILSNVKWGENGTGTKGQAVTKEILDELTAVNSKSDSEKLDVIKKYVNLNSSPITATAAKNDDGSVTYSNLAIGYYLVKDASAFVPGENDAYTTYVMQVTDGTLTFKRKSDVPRVEKKIVEGENRVDTNEASIGDSVSFEITGTLPTNFADYKEYAYIFNDTMSRGLTYNNDVKVEIVNGGSRTDVTTYFYRGATTDSATGVTTLKVGIVNLKAFANLTPAVNVDKDSKIVVTYSATLNKDAVIAGEGNDNKVKLTYSNNPNNSGNGTTTPPPTDPDEPEPTTPVGETPESRTVTYTTELTILKTDENGKVLTGAEFTLTGDGVKIVVVKTDTFEESADGEYWKLKNGTYTKEAPVTGGGSDDNSDLYESTTTKYAPKTTVAVRGEGQTETNVVGEVDAAGRVTFSGLGAGTYTITETKTPAGYNTIDPVSFTIAFENNAFSVTNISEGNQIIVEGNTLHTTIVNKSGATLPSTGGIGTTIFYVLGAILVVGAGVLLILRRRMSREK